MAQENEDRGEPRDDVRIPIVEERLETGKKTVETGRVSLSSRVTDEEVLVSDTGTRVSVRVERVPVDILVDEAPTIRTEGEHMIVPVFEEVLVRRIRITEEVHLIRERTEEPLERQVTLRRNDVEIEYS